MTEDSPAKRRSLSKFRKSLEVAERGYDGFVWLHQDGFIWLHPAIG